MYSRSVSILLLGGSVEDNSLLSKSLDQLAIPCKVIQTDDFSEAIKQIRKSKIQNRNPQIVVIEYSWFKKQGKAMLSKIQSHPRIRYPIIFIMTESTDSMSIEELGENKISGYINKSNMAAGFGKSMELLFMK